MMSHKDDVSSVLYGVLKNTLVGTIAVWVTRNGVRRVGWVRQGMIEGDNWSHTDDDLLSTTFKQIQESFACVLQGKLVVPYQDLNRKYLHCLEVFRYNGQLLQYFL